VEVQRPVAERDLPMVCAACLKLMRRCFVVPRINMLHWAFDDAPVGMSATDAVSQLREEDRAYETRSYAKPEPTPSMVELAQQYDPGLLAGG
jgi:hypothetical protein